MMPINGANSGIDTPFDIRLTRPKPPVPTPARATPMGIPIAITDPNETTRITMAKAKPISSLSGGSNSASTAPPISTVSPSSSGMSSRISAPISDAVVWSTFTSKFTLANAMSPPGATWFAPSGE